MRSVLNIGDFITFYINKDVSFKLRDIVRWCESNPKYEISEKLLLYIDDNNLRNSDKWYYIVSESSYSFMMRGASNEYEKYFGYSLKCDE